MEQIKEMLKQAEKAAIEAKASLSEQEKAISKLPDGFQKNILKQAAKKAKEGDVDAVNLLIQKLQNGA